MNRHEKSSENIRDGKVRDREKLNGLSRVPELSFKLESRNALDCSVTESNHFDDSGSGRSVAPVTSQMLFSSRRNVSSRPRQSVTEKLLTVRDINMFV